MAKKLLWLPTLFILLWFFNLLLPLGGFENYTQRIWLMFMLSLGLISLYVLKTRWTLNRKNLAIGLGLAILVWSPITSVITFLTFYAGTLVFNSSSNRITVLEGRLTRIFGSILLGIMVAIPLSAFNVFMAVSSNMAKIELQNPIGAAMLALNPGVSEEVIFRFFIYALCVSLLKGKVHPKVQIWCVMLMVVPHVLLHLPDTFLTNPVEGVVSMIILSLLFGLPMAILQLRRGLEAAIALHWFIDFIRFLVLGI